MTNRKINPSDVEHIAHLARIELHDGDREKFAGELNEIFSYVNKLQEVDTNNVEPMFHAVPVHDIMREDEVKPSLTREEVLSNAPEKEDVYFKMPPVLDTGE